MKARLVKKRKGRKVVGRASLKKKSTGRRKSGGYGIYV